MARETFDELSTFYLAMWRHMDAFFSENRWIQFASLPDIDQRIKALAGRYNILSAKIHDPVLSTQVNEDFETVVDLTRMYQNKYPEPGNPWFRRAAKTRSYLQELGIRYAELAFDRAS